MSYGRASWLDGLTARLTLWYGGILIALVVLAVLGARLAATRAIDRAQQLALAHELEQHRLRIEGEGLAEIGRFVAERRKQTTIRWFVRVTDVEGRTLVYDAPAMDVALSGPAVVPRDGTRTLVARGPEGEQIWRLASTRVAERWWLQLGVDDRPRRALIGSIEKSLWALLAVVLALGLLGGVLVTHRALLPIRQMTEACRRIVDSGDVTLRVAVRDERGELGRLAALFNRVMRRNEQLVQGMRQALDNVAHDLRTPLSRLRSGVELALGREHAVEPLRSGVELALGREHAVEPLREALADCVEESERVLSMLHTLMDISEAESGVMRLAREPLRLRDVADDVLDLYRHVAEERGLRIALVASDASTLCGDRRKRFTKPWSGAATRAASSPA